MICLYFVSLFLVSLLSNMISFPKNKKRRTAIIFIALLLLSFFCFLKIDQNYFKVNAPTRTELDRQNFKKESFGDKDEHIFGRLKVSDDLNKNNGESNEPADKTDIVAEKDLPKRLEIPKLGINANIQYVGLNSGGEMGVPSNGSDVAWFNLGTRPGKVGSAVIAGHLDDRNGRPAVFWDVDKLAAGDAVYVIDGNNNKKRFRVVSLEKYKTGTAPVERIFGANDGIYLNLITCGGVWDNAKNNYTERLVVFTEHSE